MIILVIDSIEEYPNVESLIKSDLLKQEKVIHVPIRSTDIIEQDPTIPSILEESSNLSEDKVEIFVLSYNVEKMSKICKEFNLLPFYRISTEQEFKEGYVEFKELYSEYILPKLKVSSSRSIDLLELSDLFRVTDTKTLKYINGSKGSVPVLIPYNGFDTFEKISSFRGGVLVPAREMDVFNSSSDGSGLHKNETNIMQYILGGDSISSFRYSVKTNPNYNLVWTEKVTIDDSNIIDLNKVLSEMDVDKKLSLLTFYIELERHKGVYYISKIHQGVHPFYEFE